MLASLTVGGSLGEVISPALKSLITASGYSEYMIPADVPRLTFISQCKALTKARKTNPELKAAHTQMLQQGLRTRFGKLKKTVRKRLWRNIALNGMQADL